MNKRIELEGDDKIIYTTLTLMLSKIGSLKDDVIEDILESPLSEIEENLNYWLSVIYDIAEEMRDTAQELSECASERVESKNAEIEELNMEINTEIEQLEQEIKEVE